MRWGLKCVLLQKRSHCQRGTIDRDYFNDSILRDGTSIEAQSAPFLTAKFDAAGAVGIGDGIDNESLGSHKGMAVGGAGIAPAIKAFHNNWTQDDKQNHIGDGKDSKLPLERGVIRRRNGSDECGDAKAGEKEGEREHLHDDEKDPSDNPEVPGC
jgi:hypothetical protein